MPKFDVFDARDFIAGWPTGHWPQGTPDNSTDTLIGGIHFNTSTLDKWHYQLYDNGTLSNGSKCYLTFAPYEPKFLFTNGTFLNNTKCYSAINSIGDRGFTGIGFAVAFGLGLVLTITALAKHGPHHLPHDRRFAPIGRRWQWYWGLFVCACALISLITNVDVDRYYLQELPIVISSFFWFLMCMGSTAQVWEAVRHWGSWMERQFIDPNPFVYKIDDRRAKTEFWIPLVAYLFMWLNFFMVVPRGWSFVEKQRSPEQQLEVFVPGVTSVRFKAGGFFLAIAWFITLFSLQHSVRHYVPHNRGIMARIVGVVKAVPFRFVLIIPLLGVMIGYQIASSFMWRISLLRYPGIIPLQYGLGYGPSVLIIYIQTFYGFFAPNEDKELYRQRRERGEMLDRELGIVRKPAWWRRIRGEHLETFKDRLARNVKDAGGLGAGRRDMTAAELDARQEALKLANVNDDIELAALQDPNNPRLDRAGARSLGRGPPAVVFEDDDLGQPSPPPPYKDQGRLMGSSTRSNSSSTTRSMGGPPQKVRSMLDI